MELKKIIIAGLLLFCIFFQAGSTQAADGISGEFGISFNTYSLEKLNEFAQERGGSPVNGGIGFNLGLEKEVNDNVNAGVEGEYLPISYKDLSSDSEIKASSMGILLTASYGFLNNFKVSGAVGQYMARLNYFENTDTAFTPGMKFGLEGNFPISESLTLAGGGNYRAANAGDYEFSGLEFNISARMKF